VLDELLAVRRRFGGLTQYSMTACPILCHALGDGDPVAAFASLHTAAKTHEMDQGLAAGLASLGIGGATGGSVLDRLESFATQAHIDQRSARRWADEGMVRLARLIVTNWTMVVPVLRVVVRQQGADALMVAAATERPLRVEMETPMISIAHDGQNAERVAAEFVPASMNREGWELRVLGGVLAVNLVAQRVTVTVRWVGELWPEFVVQTDAACTITHRCLGNTLSLSAGATPASAGA